MYEVFTSGKRLYSGDDEGEARRIYNATLTLWDAKKIEWTELHRDYTCIDYRFRRTTLGTIRHWLTEIFVLLAFGPIILWLDICFRRTWRWTQALHVHAPWVLLLAYPLFLAVAAFYYNYFAYIIGLTDRPSFYYYLHHQFFSD